MVVICATSACVIGEESNRFVKPSILRAFLIEEQKIVKKVASVKAIAKKEEKKASKKTTKKTAKKTGKK